MNKQPQTKVCAKENLSDRVTAEELTQEILILLKEFFYGEFAAEGANIDMQMPSGQNFRFHLEEV